MNRKEEELLRGKGVEIGGMPRGGGRGAPAPIRDFRSGSGAARLTRNAAKGMFEMPKGTTGSTPKTNRLGQTSTPVKKLESNAESYVQSLPEATKRAMQEKAFPRINQTPPKGPLKQKQALRGEEFQRRYEGARETRDAARQARKDKFGIKFEQGGPVRSSRDYGK